MASISHPTDRPNYSVVYLGDKTLYFSYQTLIAFRAPGYGLVVRQNDWSATTGKHLNYIDGGDKSKRLTGELFTAKAREAGL